MPVSLPRHPRKALRGFYAQNSDHEPRAMFAKAVAVGQVGSRHIVLQHCISLEGHVF